MNGCICRLHSGERTAAWLLYDLREAGYSVWLEGHRFYVAPRGRLGPAARAAIARHRDAIHRELLRERRN